MFLKLVIFHKNQKNTILNKLMKKETNCNFVQDNDNDEENEDLKNLLLIKIKEVKDEEEFMYQMPEDVEKKI